VNIDRTSPRRIVPLALGVLTLAAVVLLFIQDAAPRSFPAGSHAFLAAFSLAGIALAYLAFQLAQRRSAIDLAKPILLAAAFLFWAANQLWPNLPQAGLFNDIAIGLFVLDVFLVIAGRPAQANDGAFSEFYGSQACRCDCGCCWCGGQRNA
jgi:hypothetical protein